MSASGRRRARLSPLMAVRSSFVTLLRSGGEGNLDGITIVVEFDSLDAARRFYESPEYTAARALREKAAETDLLLVEGV